MLKGEKIYEVFKKYLNNNDNLKNFDISYGYEKCGERAKHAQLIPKNSSVYGKSKIHYELLVVGKVPKIGYGLHVESKKYFNFYKNIIEKFKNELTTEHFKNEIYDTKSKRHKWIHFNYDLIDENNFEEQVNICINYLLKLYNLINNYLEELIENNKPEQNIDYEENKVQDKKLTIEEIMKSYKINASIYNEVCKMSFSYKDFDKKDVNNEPNRNVLSYKGIYKIIIRVFEEDCYGVYNSTEYKYIGSASGENGMIGRWDTHISKSGDAKKLKNKLESVLYNDIKKEVIFVPLLFVKSDIGKSEINQLENYYKEKHNTRYSKNNPNGLNEN